MLFTHRSALGEQRRERGEKIERGEEREGRRERMETSGGGGGAPFPPTALQTGGGQWKKRRGVGVLVTPLPTNRLRLLSLRSRGPGLNKGTARSQYPTARHTEMSRGPKVPTRARPLHHVKHFSSGLGSLACEGGLFAASWVGFKDGQLPVVSRGA